MEIECSYTGHHPIIDQLIRSNMKAKGFSETGSGMALMESRRDITFRKRGRVKLATIKKGFHRGINVRDITED